MELVDSSCSAASNKEYATALEKAKEASAKEKNLIRLQEQSGMGDTHNLDLTSLVKLLGNTLTRSQRDALVFAARIRTYSQILRCLVSGSWDLCHCRPIGYAVLGPVFKPGPLISEFSCLNYV